MWVAPFTFGFEQVGTNCGLIGQNAVVEIDGVAYWMSNKGFFLFDGTVKSLSCTIEDYVYDDVDTTKGQQLCAAINNLFTEVVWYYPNFMEPVTMIAMRFITMENRQGVHKIKFLEECGTQVPKQELHGWLLKFIPILMPLNLILQQQELFP